ncbi:hypothetical protein RRG08_022870 [Elysia crispata]|uniref:Uncharacterized protein n=1 Tax=Elysia crispata TaxID=231223 RepID=A0AAE1D8R5_9GAST|nr:hypothetical protein RRG08_022870 [Elysia crispata]
MNSSYTSLVHQIDKRHLGPELPQCHRCSALQHSDPLDSGTYHSWCVMWFARGGVSWGNTVNDKQIVQ